MIFQRAFRRSIVTMSSSSNVSPFTKTVVGAMRKLYPEKLADSSFDNTGLLLEAPYRPNHLKNSALLTIDLTKEVADEAIRRKDSIIVTYHPIIFRALKSITLANSQQNTLLRLAQEGISVYSPHTAVDAAPNGLNDWLVEVITHPTLATNTSLSSSSVTSDIKPIPHSSEVVTPVQNPPTGFEKAGYGRIVRFESSQKLGDIISRIDKGLGPNLTGLSVAVPQYSLEGQKFHRSINSVGICAGSGGSMLNGLDVDLLFTGELSHHDALAAIEQGKCVITVFHSNTERGFLKARMKSALETEVANQIHRFHGGKEDQAVLGGSFDIHISETDRDPYEIVMASELDGVSW